jgi:GDPmannose 4,6-dehydratase
LDLQQADGAGSLVRATTPTHIFNLAGVTSVAQSWVEPAKTVHILSMVPLSMLEALTDLADHGTQTRLIQASSGEVFGNATESPQTELTPRRPVSPYGVAKNFADDLVRVFRDRGANASSAILFNHESPRRPETFVSKKIARAVARIASGDTASLKLGNLDARRDWGYAPDFVEALITIANAPEPGDFVVATGDEHSVRDFVAAAFAHVGIDNWKRHVSVDPGLYRTVDAGSLVGDASRLRALGWAPTRDFNELVGLLVDSELAAISR